jgi:hypothetical protein
MPVKSQRAAKGFARRTLALLLAALSGCAAPHPPVKLPPPDNARARKVDLQIEDPAYCAPVDMTALSAAPPNLLDASQPPKFRDLTLEEAVQITLANSDVLRDLGGSVLREPETVHTINDPAIVSSEPRIGVEGALSEFDASLAAEFFFQKNDRPINNEFQALGIPPGPNGTPAIFLQDVGAYNVELSKRSAFGTNMALRNVIDYNFNNAPANNNPNLPWGAYVEGELRQPLLQGGGANFNRIAGPRSAPGIYTGVLLARLNEDISLAEFESGVRDLVSNTESAYWELYFAYRDLDAKMAARDRALRTWQEVHAYYLTGRRGGDADQEAQAREQYFRLDAEVQTALAGRPIEKSNSNLFQGAGGVYTHERRLRRAMGILANDGELLRPVSDPPQARVEFAWSEAVSEALTRRVEIRRQGWRIRKRELELTAARNFLLPRFDAVARQRFRGLGHDLLDPDPSDYAFDNAYQNLTGGEFQEWDLGVEFSLPLGFRQAHAAVRNATLRLARERMILAEQQHEILTDLSNAVAETRRAFVVAQTYYNRRFAAYQQLQALEAIYQNADEAEKPRLLDLLLDAQQRLADSDSRYYRSLSEYAFAIKNVHFEKGSLLEANQVYLSEGPWPSKAYYDASRRASLTRPAPILSYVMRKRAPVVTQGPHAQHTALVEYAEQPLERLPPVGPTPAAGPTKQ